MKKIKLQTHDEFLKESLKDPEFKKLYEKEMQTFDISLKLIGLRIKLKLTQAQLARLMGTTQSVVARLENGNYNRCSLKTLRKIAKVTGTRLEINFEPIRKVA